MLTLRSQSFCRYRIQGDVPSPYGDAFHERLKEQRFRPLQGEEERAFGWVTADNLLITDFHLGTVMRGEWTAFALRVDKRRVNARLLRAQFDLEVVARLKAARDAGDDSGGSRRGRVRLGREERRELREGLRRDLLMQTSPSVDAYTVLLHTKRKVAHVLSLGRTANELVRLCFRDTFEADIVPLTPWQRGQELLEADAIGGADLCAAFQDLRRTDFGRITSAPVPAGRHAEAPVPATRITAEGTMAEGTMAEGTPTTAEAQRVGSQPVEGSRS